MRGLFLSPAVRPDLLAVLRPLVLWLLLACGGAFAAPVLTLSPAAPLDVLPAGTLAVAAAGDDFPASREQIDGWLAARPPIYTVSIFGGAYWLHARVRHEALLTTWLLDPNNTIIERVEARVYGSDGSVQRLSSGYHAPHLYAMHYGVPLKLAPQVDYDVVLRFESPYYASVPRFELLPESAYRSNATQENIVALGCLGAVAALGVFNLFLYLLTRTRSHLYYAGQMLAGCWGWSMTFQVPAELFGWHDLRWHYLPFFLVAMFGSLFCAEFLELRRHAPRMDRAFRVLALVALALSPSAVFAVPYAHGIATIVIAAWINLALYCGIRSWLRGFQPARFFVMAMLALALPASIILPGNLDLIPDLVRNAELLTLVGSMLDGLLQAFALADRIRLARLEKDSYSAQLSQALSVAHTDVLTGIGNRFAFGGAIQQHVDERRHGEVAPQLLMVIDLDGLKVINDLHGHQRGDELIKTLADGLRALTAQSGSCFRLGGDEFAIFAPAHDEPRLRAGLAHLEAQLQQLGFGNSGISFGVAYWSGPADPQELVHQADRNMYEHKLGRKRDRASVGETMAAALSQ
jgi:diguanylate cyclase (GGDEF)-like protein